MAGGPFKPSVGLSGAELNFAKEQLVTKPLIVVIAVLISSFSFAKDKEKVSFTAISNNPFTVTNTIYIPGHAGTSKTKCTGSATTSGNTTSGSADCDSKYTSPTPPTPMMIRSLNIVVDGVLERANGVKLYVSIWCRKASRDCRQVVEKELQEGELDGTTLWLMSKDPLTDKELRIKYKVLESKPLPTEPMATPKN